MRRTYKIPTERLKVQSGDPGPACCGTTMRNTKSHAAQFITNKIIPKKQLAEKLTEDKLKGDTVSLSGPVSIF